MVLPYNVVFKILAPDSRGKVFCVLPLNKMMVVSFLEIFFIRLWKFPSTSGLLFVFLGPHPRHMEVPRLGV